MKTTETEIVDQDVEIESLTLIEDIEEFISDIDYFISYALRISELENLPPELKVGHAQYRVLTKNEIQ